MAKKENILAELEAIITAKVDTKEGKRDLRSFLKFLQGESVPVKLDTRGAHTAIRNLETKLMNTFANAIPKVSLDMSVANKQINDLKKQLSNLTVDVNLNTKGSTGGSSRKRSNSNVPSSDDGRLRTLRAKRADAYVKADRASQKYGEDHIQYLRAKRKYMDANADYVNFAAGIGVIDQKQLADEYGKMLSQLSKNNPFAKVLEKQYIEALKAFENNKARLDQLDPLKQTKASLQESSIRKKIEDANRKESEKARADVFKEAYAQDKHTTDLLTAQAKAQANAIKEAFKQQAFSAKEMSSGQIAKSLAMDLNNAFKSGDQSAIKEYTDRFRQAMQEYVSSKNNLSANAEANLYKNMARHLKDASPVFDELIAKARQLKQVEKEIQEKIGVSTRGGNGFGSGGSNGGGAKSAYALKAEINKYAAQAEEAWLRVQNTPKGSIQHGVAVQEFDNAKKAFSNATQELIKFQRELGGMSPGQAAKTLTTIASSLGRNHQLYKQLIEDAQRLNKEQDKINKDAKGQGTGRWFNSGLATGFIHFVGRSSKGWGSAGEAIADALSQAQAMGGTLGKIATVASGVTAVFTGIIAVGSGLIKSVTLFGDIIQQIGTTIYNALKPGIELYKQQQSALFSFDAALRSNALVGGKSLAEQPEVSRGISADLIKRATIDAEMSAFSLEELLRSLQGTLPILLSKGMNLEQAYNVNKGVAGVAKQIQLTPSQILQETRDLAQGSITSRGSQVAGALGITNADLKQFQGDADKIFDFLMKKFENYSELLNEFEDTALGRWQQLSERWQTVTKNLVDAIAPQFKGLFETLIDMTGKYVDDSGRYLDALTGKWMNEDGSEFTGKFSELDNPHFKLSPEMDKVKDLLVDILDLTAQTLDNIVQFAKETWGTKEPLDIIKDLISGVLVLFELSVNAALSFAKMLSKSGPILTGMINLGTTIVAIFYELYIVCATIIDITQHIISLAAEAYYWITGNKAAAANEQAYRKKVAKSANERYDSLPDLRYYDNIDDFLKDFSASDPNGYKEIEKAFAKYKGKDVTGANKGNSNGYGLSDVKGRQVNQEDEKSRKKALQEAKKAMKDNIKALKEALKDHIADLKDTLEKNKIAYDEGFMSLREYLTQKAAIEREEAEATLEEAQAERAEILATPYEKEEDRLRDLREVNRAIKNAQKSLDKSIVAQNGVAKVIKQYSASFENVGKSHDIMYRTQLGQPVDLSNISGMSNTEVAYRFLTSQGFNDAISQGIIASLKGESLSNPKDVHVDSNNKLSGGIASWNGERFEALKNFAIANNSDWQDIRTQLAFLVSEIQNGGSEAENFAKALQYFNENGKTAEAMVEAWTKFIERPNDIVGEANARKRFLPEVSNELQASPNRQVQVSQGNPTSIYDAIQTALTRDNYLGQTLKYGTVACVEAATKLGAYFSTTLAEAVEKGIVNTDALDLFLNRKDVGWIDFSKANLEPGDLIFFDGYQQNQHVMIYQGNNTVTGNFSSRNGGNGAVGQQDLDEYLQYSGLTPTHIRKTSRTSVFGNLGSPIQDMASQSKEEAEARKLFQEALEKLRQSDVDVEGLQLGKYVVQLSKLEAEKLDKLKSTEVNKYEGADRDRYIQNVEFSYRQKSADLLIKVFTEQAEYNLEKIEEDWADRSIEMLLGNIPVDKYSYWIEKYADYFYGTSGGGTEDGIWGVFNLINKITEQAKVYLKDGNLKAYRSAMAEVKKLRQKYAELIKSSVDDIKKPFDTALDLFNTSDKYTPSQREYGERQIKSWQAQAEVTYWEGYIKTLRSVKQGLIDAKAPASELLKIDKELWDASMAKEKAKLIAEQYPNYLRDLKKVSKDALDDGLVTFLTDGINEAENLGEALRNLAIGILKEIQKFSAQRMVKSLMDKWFGGYEVDNPQTLHRTNADIGMTSAEVAADIESGARAIASAMWNAANIISNGSLSTNYTVSGVTRESLVPGNNMLNLSYDEYMENKANPYKFNPSDYEISGSAVAFKSSIDEFKLSNTELINANMANTAATTADTAVEQASVSLDTAAKITDQESNALTAENNVQLANVSAQLSSVTVGSAHASGGYITGPGTGTSDSIPARLSAGEYVIKAEAVKRMGVNYLNAINNGNFTKIKTGVHHYAQGGLVSDLAQEQTARGISNFGKDISNNISNTANISVALVRDEQEGMKQLLRSPEGQRIMLDFSRRYASVTSRF